MAQAAVATTKAILERRPTRVVNLGSAGSLFPSIYGIQRPTAVINRDLNADALRAAGLPPYERIELGSDGPVLGTGDSFVAGGPEREAPRALPARRHGGIRHRPRVSSTWCRTRHDQARVRPGH